MVQCTFLAHPQPRDSGDYRHRITLPGRALATVMDVVELQTTHPDWVAHCVGTDILVACMVADTTLEAVFAERTRRGLPTVYELSDDFRAFPTSLPGHGFYRVPEHQARIERLARSADLLQCSSHGLRARYGTLNPRCAVLPNQLSEVPPLAPVPEQRLRTPVLGWAASAGHLDDARGLAAALIAWCTTQGLAPHEAPVLRLMAPTSIRGVFERAGLPLDWHAPAGFDAYLAFLDGMDIGFAPLGDSAFAEGRSDGKFLEYASRGVVCIASARGEYLHGIRAGETGLLFAGHDGFVRALSQAIDDAPARLAMRAAAHAQVLRERTHAAAASERFALYGGLLERAGLDAAPLAPPARALRALVDPDEAALVDATVHHGQGRLDAALAGYLAMIDRHPDFHLPWERGALIAQAFGATEDAARFGAMADHALARALAAPIGTRTAPETVPG
jgi:hypothetical protein